MDSHSPLLLGIDVGTTTLSFALIALPDGHVVHAQAIPHAADLPSPGQQDAARIASLALSTARGLLDRFPAIAAIGLTGQMHGVVCLDDSGEPVSPLYTWQCPLADAALCDDILKRTGQRVYPGYGHATLTALMRANALPPRAAQYCTIMDYIAMRLTGQASPLMHPSNAASLGLFDPAAGDFDRAALRTLGLDALRTPAVAQQEQVLGHCGAIPVSVAIGDNQASFFGSVREEDSSILLNYGTGSQLSLVVDSPAPVASSEIRPYLFGRYLLCHSALCGGRAYALLKRFFAAYASAAGLDAGDPYAVMNAMAEQAYREKTALSVCTQFCGTRDNPHLRGGITDIGEENFTPQALTLGVLSGMVSELRDAFDPAAHPQICRLVASGNAVQKNAVLRALLKDAFAMPMQLSAQREEAAFGAALHGGVCAGVLTCKTAKALIHVQDA